MKLKEMNNEPIWAKFKDFRRFKSVEDAGCTLIFPKDRMIELTLFRVEKLKRYKYGETKTRLFLLSYVNTDKPWIEEDGILRLNVPTPDSNMKDFHPCFLEMGAFGGEGKKISKNVDRPTIEEWNNGKYRKERLTYEPNYVTIIFKTSENSFTPEGGSPRIYVDKAVEKINYPPKDVKNAKFYANLEEALGELFLTEEGTIQPSTEVAPTKEELEEEIIEIEDSEEDSPES